MWELRETVIARLPSATEGWEDGLKKLAQH